jgi:hypothetical protein
MVETLLASVKRMSVRQLRQEAERAERRGQEIYAEALIQEIEERTQFTNRPRLMLVD